MYYRVNIPRNYNFARQCTIINEHEISKYEKVQTLKKKKKNRTKNRISTNYDKHFLKNYNTINMK